MKRVLVIALQEATRDLIDPWVEQGLLPNIAALMGTGTCGYVRAEAPLITPHSWANILTGVDAGQHGIFDYWQRGADGVFHETSTASLNAPPIWARLRGTGLRSTYLNLPMTWPLPGLDGLVVSGSPGYVPTRETFTSNIQNPEPFGPDQEVVLKNVFHHIRMHLHPRIERTIGGNVQVIGSGGSCTEENDLVFQFRFPYFSGKHIRC